MDNRVGNQFDQLDSYWQRKKQMDWKRWKIKQDFQNLVDEVIVVSENERDVLISSLLVP
jgi:hypothetical protein